MPEAPCPITRKKEEGEGGATPMAVLRLEEEVVVVVVVVVVLQRERRRGRGEDGEEAALGEEGDAVARSKGSGEKTLVLGNVLALLPMLLLPVRKREE